MKNKQKKVIYSMKGVIDGLKDFQKLLDAIQTNQIVKKYMSSHNLVGKEIFNNSCYHIDVAPLSA